MEQVDDVIPASLAAQIRRSREEKDLVLERECPKSFPSRRSIACETEHLELHLHRSRWTALEEDREEIRRRVHTAKLFADGKHVGSFRLAEYDVAGWLDREDFYQWLDDYSSAAAELAWVICTHWEDVSDFIDYGTLLELERAWVIPDSGSIRRFRLAGQELVKLVPKRALMVLKAYPLEYEGVVTPANSRARDKRARALQRFYRGTLNMQPFPGAAGEEGWMFNLPERLKDVIDPPALIDFEPY